MRGNIVQNAACSVVESHSIKSLSWLVRKRGCLQSSRPPPRPICIQIASLTYSFFLSLSLSPLSLSLTLPPFTPTLFILTFSAIILVCILVLFPTNPPSPCTCTRSHSDPSEPLLPSSPPTACSAHRPAHLPTLALFLFPARSSVLSINNRAHSDPHSNLQYSQSPSCASSESSAMNMFNTDSGFRPPSPLAFTPSTGLFGESVPFEDFKLPGQEFLNLPTSPPPIASDPSMALFNPSEQRYFSEFLDALVIDQDFTFDPSSIPNLPNLPLFTQDNMPSSLGLDNRSYMLPPTSSSAFAAPGLLGSTSMDFDMASPSQSGYVGPQSLPNQGGLGGFSPPPSQQQPGISSGSPSSLHYSTSAQISVPTKRKTNKGADAAGSNRRSVSGQNDSSKISTPIQQLSKLSLNNGPTSSKKNKRDDDDSSVSSPPPMTPRSREHREARDERDPSVSDGSVSDTSNANPTSASSTGASGPATAKRKPYKELLTEEEKRANHIASEQKRRNTIRNGFKDMTDIIPDLRDVNSSKSTILFKAVDFIKQLEKRNRVLQEKANQLESRLINQGKVGAGPGVGANGISGMSGSALDDQRLQDIPHIYPVPCSR